MGRRAGSDRSALSGFDDDLEIADIPKPSPSEGRRIAHPETGVPVLTMRDQLSVFQGISNPNNWSGPFRGSPARWKASDGEVVLAAIKAAADNPVERPLDRLRARPKDQPVKVVATEEGTLTVPDEEAEPASSQERGTRHTEIQFLLLQLGSDMGFDVYVARNDQTKEWQGKRFADISRRRPSLPQQFDA